ncbi:hypothetical protein [Streptomyces pratensis]|uniref:hypothetical protein n=1 Tax=Streptomyces pratensis TaxID=1169025 RepID=UPI0030196E35
MTGPTVARRTLASGLIAMALAAAGTSCVDSRSAPPPPPVPVEAADLRGTWEGWAGSTLTLRRGGAAEVANLDGQEFRFDDEWRMTGAGSWSLIKPGRYSGGNTVGSGYVVRVAVTRSAEGGEGAAERTGAPSPSPLPTEAAARTSPPPQAASWDLGVTENKAGELTLYFLTSDPDVRDTYRLTKKA